MTDEFPKPPDDGAISSPSALDDILSRAVERQIAEQRALRDSLAELRDAVRSPTSPAPQIDTHELEQSLRQAVEKSAASLVDHVRDIREIVAPQLERVASSSQTIRGLSDELAALREAVDGVSADVEGIAQALIDLNAGLRGWAGSLDENVGSLLDAVGVLREAPRKRSKREDELDVEAIAATVSEAEPTLGPRFDVMEERIKETAELSLYLSDQIEDLDSLMNKVSELPPKLEGVVSQALRRTLTARSKLDKVAENALDDVLGELDEHVDGLNTALQRLSESDDQLRKIGLNQVELGSRIDGLQSAFIERLETLDADRRRSEEILARAIDRSAKGLDPRAFDSLSKAAQAKPRAKAKPKAKAAPRKRKPKAKPKPEPEPIPIPDDDDEELT